MASVEGFPYIDEVISRIKDQGNIRKVILMPFMIVAGDHARNDMAGDEEDSWLHKFKNEGFEVEIVMKGLGEIKAIRDIFVEHSKKSQKITF